VGGGPWWLLSGRGLTATAVIWSPLWRRALSAETYWRHSTEGHPPGFWTPFWTRNPAERLGRGGTSQVRMGFNEAAHPTPAGLRVPPTARMLTTVLGPGAIARALAEPAGPSPQQQGEWNPPPSSRNVQVRKC